jgi:hypothetical protein
MIETRDGEHAHDVERERHDHGGCTYANPKYGDAREMQQYEGGDAQPIDAIDGAMVTRIVQPAATRVEPPTQRGENGVAQNGCVGAACVHELTIDACCDLVVIYDRCPSLDAVLMPPWAA